MSNDVKDFAAVMLIIVASVSSLLIVGLGAFRLFAWTKRSAQLPPKEFSDQLSQLQRSVDAMALEVERIAEGQRFSTRLLSEGRDREVGTLR